MNDKLALTVEEAARVTGIGRSKLYAAMKDGLLQARKFGRRTIILPGDLEKFLSALPAAGQPESLTETTLGQRL